MEDVKTIIALEPEKSARLWVKHWVCLSRGREQCRRARIRRRAVHSCILHRRGRDVHPLQGYKENGFDAPDVYHALLSSITDSVVEYVKYQADSGAQVVQIFDSWASEFCPADFEKYCLPYLKRIVDEVKVTHPDLPLSCTPPVLVGSLRDSRPLARMSYL